jgi:hypothetical protein
MNFSVSQIAKSCNKQLLKNEKAILAVKESKLKKNRMQLKNEAIQNFTCNLVDVSIKKEKRRATANLRRMNSK